MTDGDGSVPTDEREVSPAAAGDTSPPTGSDASPDAGPSDADLPDGWIVWNDEPGGRAIYAYRPDVFDTKQFPAACLPTLYVAAGHPNRPAAEAEYGPTEVWRVQFFLEPEVEVTPARTFDTRADALTAARELASEFARGELDHRGAYQIPRDEYLDELDELTGGDDQ